MLEYMPERYKKRCFHVETDAKGVEWCYYDDLKMYANRMALAGAGGMTLEERKRVLKGEMRYSDIRSGAFDPAQRLVEMAQDDIEQAVVYPTQFLGISSRPDLDFAEAQARAYNQWVADYCNYAPTRLFGIAAAPQTDLDRCIRIVEDARKLGHVGVFLRPNPNQEGQWFCDGSYDRLWAALQDLDLAVGFHPFLMPDMPGAVRQLGLNNFLAPGAKSIMEMTADDRSDRRRHLRQQEHLLHPGARQRVRHADRAHDADLRRRARALPAPALHLPGGERRLDRADPRAARSPLRDLPLGGPAAQDEAVGVLQAPVLDLVRPRREHAQAHRAEPARRRRPDHLGERLPAPRREDPGRRRSELREQMEGLPDAVQQRIFGLNAIDLYGLPEPN